MRKSLLTLAVAAALAVSAGLAFTADPIDKLEARAEGGDTQAMYEAGQAYLEGKNVPRDEDRALIWLARATEGPRANARAALLLAEHYERLSPTPANRGQMVQFYRRAAVLGHTTAQTRLGSMLLASASDARLSPANQKEASDKGRAMLEHAANAGHAPAAAALADAFRRGFGVTANDVQADRFDRRAADLGDANAAWRLSQAFLETTSPQYQPVTGIKYLRTAANANFAPAMTELARRYAEGDGIREDRTQARTWAERAAQTGDSGASSLLARLKDQMPPPVPAATTPATTPTVAPVPTIAVAAVPQSDPAATQSAQTPRVEDLAFDTGNGAPLGELAGKTYDELLADVGRLQASLAAKDAELTQLRKSVADHEQTIASLTTERDEAVALVRSIQRTLGAPERALPASHSTPARTLPTTTTAKAPDTRDGGGQGANEAGLAALRSGDLAQARRQFELAAQAGHPGAFNNLGMMYLQGRGVQPSVPQAINYLSQAAERGNGVAANNLGYLYQHGRGVAPDREQAIAWYRRAVALGHKASDRQLRALGAASAPDLAASF